MRPLSPWPIVGLTVIVGAIAWASPWFDDMVALAALVGVCDLLLWLGLRGDPQAVPSTASRIAVAIGGAVPAAGSVLTFIPWFVDGDGMQGLAVVVGMLIFGLPLTIAVFAVVLFLLAKRPRVEVLGRVLVVAGGSVAVGWLVAALWATAGDGSAEVAANMLAFPGFATTALVLPALERRAMRR